METQTRGKSRFELAIARFDQANAADPNQTFYGEAAHPKELLYARRMTGRLLRFSPNASEALRLAARCQHIERWSIPRSDYPEGKIGYKQWRNRLMRFHADRAGEIMNEVGYDQSTIERVQSLVMKRGLKNDPEAQALEDVICLVFLEHYFVEFAAKHDEDKLVGILEKTWKKMSSEGHQAALALSLPMLQRH